MTNSGIWRGDQYNFEVEHEFGLTIDLFFQACLNACKAGVAWEEIHNIAIDVATDGLLACGILVGDKKEILANYVTAAFFPHGSKYIYIYIFIGELC